MSAALVVMPRQNSKHNKFRPRRRASQTHFFKYQLACNPIKAEEDALKRALLESLQQYKRNEQVHVKKVRSTSSPSVSAKSTLSSKRPQHQNHNQPTTTKTTTNTTKSTKLRKNSESNNNDSTSLNLNNNNNATINAYYGSNCSMSINNNTNGNAFNHNNNSISNINSAKIKNNYKPETEDFLTFICFRSAVSHDLHENEHSNLTSANAATSSNNNNQLNGKISPHSLPQSTSSSSETTASSSSSSTTTNNATRTAKSYPNRRQTRHSLRLSSSRKISENAVKVFDNSVSYEENFKRAKMALEDMQQEVISNFDDEPKLSIDKHLVKGLMSREFAGAFADEETMFDSI